MLPSIRRRNGKVHPQPWFAFDIAALKAFHVANLVMASVPSRHQILQNTLKRLENSTEFATKEPQTVALRRWLLVALADLQDQQRGSADEDAEPASSPD